MIWQKLELWTDKRGLLWQALTGHPNHRDLSMGVVRGHEVDRLLAWARSHNLEIVDRRNAR